MLRVDDKQKEVQAVEIEHVVYISMVPWLNLSSIQLVG
jgi:type II secretory pathway component PulM